MSPNKPEKRCVCCKGRIFNKREDAQYCKNCRKHKQALYAMWRTSEKRKAIDYKKLIKKLAKTNFKEGITEDIKKYLEDTANKKEQSDNIRKMLDRITEGITSSSKNS